MSRGRWLLVALLCCVALAAPIHAEEDEDADDLQQRLTEREDKRRPIEPFSVDVAGRPLIFGGEFGIELGYLRRRFLDEDEVDEPDRFLMEPAIELEAFYTFGEPLSIFLQVQGVWEEDLLGRTPDAVSTAYVQLGEAWLYSENILGSHINFDIGQLDFEDERRWWWDEELDAVRLAYERESFELALALAYELGSDRSDQSFVDPEHENVLRLLGELGWDYQPDHALELFGVHQNDHSPNQRVGDEVKIDDEDDSDGRLSWVGARAMGVFDLRARGLLGYWLDTGLVWGEEQLVEFEEIPGQPNRSEVVDVSRQNVSGWGADAGVTWLLPFALEPRVYAGYAYGSGDSDPESGTDHSYRQTDLQANEAGFGGVERFGHYGALLDPELSNLGIVTVGAGLSVLRSSSLDLVYHHYRMPEAKGSLRDIRLEGTLTGEDRDVGDEVDLVLALEEWERVEFHLIASAFRAGHAFEPEDRAWAFGGFVEMLIAF